MKEIINSNNNELNIIKFISEKGKYGMYAFVGICTYKLIDKAIDKGYNLSLDFKNLNFSLTK